MAHVQNYVDKWTDHAQPYICNEKDVVIKLEIDEEALKAQMAEYNASLSGKHGDPFQLPGYTELAPPNFDQVLIAFSPHPTSKPHDVLPKYLMNLQ